VGGGQLDETETVKILSRIKRELARLFYRFRTAPVGDAENERTPDIYDGEQSPSVPPATTDKSAPAIRWACGGFDGSRAVETTDAQVGSVRMDAKGMRYKWTSGGCEALGAVSARDYSHTIAAAFYWDGEAWIGGKFDWISTSRTSRDFTNIKDGYHGWNWRAFVDAERRAFCIVSSDGKKRTNLAEAGR
jgi:hypothetical protein